MRKNLPLARLIDVVLCNFRCTMRRAKKSIMDSTISSRKRGWCVKKCDISVSAYLQMRKAVYYIT
jgi:hypothetical protein